MTTTKSYSNEKTPRDSRFWPMYRAALKAQLPFAIISGIVFFVTLVVSFLASMPGYVHELPPGMENVYRRMFWQGIYMDSGLNVVVMVFLAALAVASAMFAYSFLHNKKTVDMYHSLPVTRPQLLRANTLAGYTAILVPFTAVYLLTMIIQIAALSRYFAFGASYFTYALLDLACIYVYIAMIFLFVAVIAVNVGTSFDMFSVSAVIGFTPMVVYLISGMMWASLTYGADFSPSEIVMLCLSPFTFMYYRFMLTVRVPDMVGAIGSSYDTYGELPNYPATLILILCGLVAAALLYVIAAVCYRRRKSEIAEQTQPGGVLQTIVKLAAAFCGAALFFAIFDSTDSVTEKIIPMLLGAVAVGLIAEIILARGVRSIKRNIKWLAAASAVYCALTLMVSFDVFGYVKRVPALESIASVQVNNYGRFEELTTWQSYDFHYRTATLTLPESIGLVQEIHKLAVDNKPPKRWTGNEYSWQNIHIEYKLKNGSTIKRRYGQIYSPAYKMLANLEDKDDYIASRSAIFKMDQYGSQSETVDYVEIYANIGDVAGNHKVFLEDNGPLVEAIKSDMLNQSLGDIQNPQSPALGFINVKYKERYQQVDRYGNPYDMLAASETVVITSEYKNTLAELGRLGLMDSLGSKLDNVERVGFLSVWYTRSSTADSYVTTMLPWVENGYAHQAVRYRTPGKTFIEQDYKKVWENGEFFSTTGRADIEAVAGVAKSQLLPSVATGAWLKDYAIACFVFESGVTTHKIVKISDLPASIAASVQKSIDDDIARRDAQNQVNYAATPMAATLNQIG